MLSPQHTVEEALRQVEDRAAMLRFFADSVREVESVPEPAFFSGLADSLHDVEEMTRAVRRALPVDALNTTLGPGPEAGR